jgi:regulatory protein
MAFVQKLTPAQALQKAKHFCGYQERCHSEVKEKLYGFGLYKKDVEQTLSTLIEENYLNEERFAIAYAGGHFRNKHWGRVKITYELKQKQVSAYNIKNALKQIEEDDYLQVLQKLTAERWLSLRTEKNIFNKLRKTQDYLMQKGFELPLIQQAIKTVREAP